MKQVGIFLILLFGITWSLGLWAAAQPPPKSLSEFYATFLPQVWAPTILAVAIIALTEGVGRLKKEVADRLRYNAGSLRWLPVAAILPAAATGLAVFAARAAGDVAPFTPAGAIPLAIGMQLITGAVGEELGWRGFLLPRLGNRFGPAVAAWVMGALWSLWHVPAWFNPSLPHQTMPMVPALTFIAAFGVFLAFVFNRAGGSVLATILAHLSLNVATTIGGVRLSSFVFWATLAVVFGAIAIFATSALAQRKGRLEGP